MRWIRRGAHIFHQRYKYVKNDVEKRICFLLRSGLTLLLAAGFFLALPRTLFDEPFSATVWSRDGRLLSAKVASDGQWRFFPYGQRAREVPRRNHDLRGQAFLPPFRSRSAGARPRAPWGRTSLREAVRAAPARLRCRRSVEPRREARTFGKRSSSGAGAAAGIQMRQGGDTRPVRLPRPLRRQRDRTGKCRMVLFRPQCGELSWGECAMLAVLPNSPALIHMRRNRERLREQAGQAARTHMERRAHRLPDVRPGQAGTAARSSRTDADGGDAPAGQDAHGVAALDARRRPSGAGERLGAALQRATGATGSTTSPSW